ncbi:MAG: lipopolysaccharide biosynthesis protein [Saprospiraceae bacterium]|nr:lipopolysaccharide biosynthesis protein [Saprospiraceae bacterium]MDW8230004.1 lipopolysaccharide biosynthesis protein [Saprospiraceae bacterium]
MAQSLSERSLAAVGWAILDRFSGSVLSFVVTILLARLLSPEDFGVVAMVMIFFDFSAVFVESGFSTALIREKTISEADKSTTFIFNLIAAVLLYGVLFASAPYIAAFFHQPLLTTIVRVMGISLIVNALSIVQHSVLIQQIDFKTQTLVRLAGVALSGSVAISMAYWGYGVWSLVARFMVLDLVATVLYWVLVGWWPSGQFSRESFRRLFGFGWRILAAAVLDKFYFHIYKLLIGRFFSAASLGFYSQAGNFTNMVINTLFRTVQSVTYPVLAKLQDDREKLKAGYRKMLQLSSFVIVPALTVLAVLAEPVVMVLVGEKWLPCVPMLQLLCLSGLTIHFSTVNLNMLLVLGRSDLSLRLEILKKMVITLAIFAGIPFGIYGLIIGEVIAAYINLFINVWYSKQLLRYSLAEQLRDIAPTLLISALVGGLVYSLRNAPFAPSILSLALLAFAAGLVYLLLHLLVKTEEMQFIRHTLLPRALKMVGKRS